MRSIGSARDLLSASQRRCIRINCTIADAAQLTMPCLPFVFFADPAIGSVAGLKGSLRCCVSRDDTMFSAFEMALPS
jgi:hypothetical protein